MAIFQKLLPLLAISVISLPNAQANTDKIATPLLDNCKQQQTQATAYSICLDEAVKQVERELESWILQTENKISASASGPQVDAAMYELKRANKYYQQYIESYCRSLFFANQGSAEAANIFRQCKIVQIRQRITLLKYEKDK
ncbi:hypothetical protein N7931_18915 [Catenovulum sp. 2E275]|uniref:hypothetical protein n=1 Tax=Catenovulum sp. 2E275 TaxID=2980497 RepID=UPI0021D3510A|nr:hypothetical protein [Catenovulum sp. 2E275]MCU4677686.1 hypothetical protein [Catenovulum sp. 2E275]